MIIEKKVDGIKWESVNLDYAIAIAKIHGHRSMSELFEDLLNGSAKYTTGEQLYVFRFSHSFIERMAASWFKNFQDVENYVINKLNNSAEDLQIISNDPAINLIATIELLIKQREAALRPKIP